MKVARSSSRGSRSRKNTLAMPALGGVETRKLIAEGEYLLEFVEVKQEEGDKAPYFAWKFKVIDDKKFEDAPVYYNTSLHENSLWNLKALLEALGADIPEEAEDIDPSTFDGMQMMGMIEHDTYEGKKKAKLVDFWAAEEEEPERDRRGKDKDRGGKSGKDRGGKDDRGGRRSGKNKEPDTYTATQINDMDQDELADVIKEAKLDVDLDKFRTLRKMQNAVVDALEREKLLEDE